MEDMPMQGPSPQNFLWDAEEITNSWNLSPPASDELQRIAREASERLDETIDVQERGSHAAQLAVQATNQNLAQYAGALRAFDFLSERGLVPFDPNLVADFRLRLCPGFFPFC